MLENLFILAVLCLLVALSEWLVQHTFLKIIGTALLVILLTAIAANTGILPAGSSAENPVPVYDGIFDFVAPLAIFFLLLQVNLRDVLKAGKHIIGLFLLGAIGTAIGVIVGMLLIDGRTHLGDNVIGMGGMLVGTYTGGSINFNALAIHYNMVTEGLLYGGAVAIDNIMTAIWMMACIAIPKFLRPIWKKRVPFHASQTNQSGDIPDNPDSQETSPFELGILFCAGFATLLLSDQLSGWFASQGHKVPSIVIVSVIALVIAQIPSLQQIRGAQLLGSFSVTLFLAVIGAFCDITAVGSIGSLGLSLLVLITVILIIHGLVLFGGSWLFKLDPDLAAVASQANVGGPASALALARSINRHDLVLPAVLTGSLGYAIGTFWGLAIAEIILTRIL